MTLCKGTAGISSLVKPTLYVGCKKLSADNISAILFNAWRQSQRDVSIGDKKQED